MTWLLAYAVAMLAALLLVAVRALDRALALLERCADLLESDDCDGACDLLDDIRGLVR